jgi:hypothetical protein
MAPGVDASDNAEMRRYAKTLTLGLGLMVAACGSSDTRTASPNHAPGAPASGSSCDHQGEAEPAPMAGMTAAHNAIRCKVQRPNGGALPPLAWSNALAAVAQGYAEQLAANGCAFQHSKTDYGENLFGGSGTNTPTAVVAKWASEERCFEYGPIPQSCTCTCGHYSQLVWADTRKVGCGMATCADNSEIWVCNYDPAGNFSGTAPY